MIDIHDHNGKVTALGAFEMGGYDFLFSFPYTHEGKEWIRFSFFKTDRSKEVGADKSRFYTYVTGAEMGKKLYEVLKGCSEKNT